MPLPRRGSLRVLVAVASLALTGVCAAVAPAGATGPSSDDPPPVCTQSQIDADQNDTAWCQHDYDGQGGTDPGASGTTSEVDIADNYGNSTIITIPHGLGETRAGQSGQQTDVYREDDATHQRVVIGQNHWTFGDDCTAGATSCTIDFDNSEGIRQSGWVFVELLAPRPNMLPYDDEVAVHLDLQPDPQPEATAVAVPGHPGEYQFSASVPSSNGTVTWGWNFDDKSVANDAPSSLTHTYAKPGTYDWTVFAYDDNGSGYYQGHLTVLAPHLAVTLKLAHASPLPKGKAVKATITVAASAGAGALSGLRLTGGGVSVAPAGAFTIGHSSPAVPAAGFTLASGTKRTFSVSLTPRKAGAYTLTSAVTGRDAAGAVVRASDVVKGSVKAPKKPKKHRH